MIFERRRMRAEKLRDPNVEKIADEAFDRFAQRDMMGVHACIFRLREIGATACANWVERETELALENHMARMRETRRLI